MKKVAIAIFILLLLTGCSMSWKRDKKVNQPVTPAEIYNALRNQMLTLEPGEVGLEPSEEMPDVWGVLMESGHPDLVMTLVALADGTTSLYFSYGGGMIGGGEHPSVVKAARSFLLEASNAYPAMTPTTSFPLPTTGRVKIYVLTYSGAYTIEAEEEALMNKTHELWPLFYLGNDVITQFRLIDEARNQK